MAVASSLPGLGLRLSLLALALAIASPASYRLGWLGLTAALLYLVAGAVLVAAAALLISLIAAVGARPGRGRAGFGQALAGLLVSSLVAGFPVSQAIKAKNLPPIHDITTDTANPPSFVALAEARKAAPNGLAYGGAGIAEQQRRAYPDIAPFFSALPADALFAKAEQAARESGWDIVAAAPAERRIEATAVSRLYAFKDDIVIRIAPEGAGSRLDARSVSRVGLGDVGVNAARIRDFLARLKAAGA